MVFNDSRVIPARLYGKKSPTGGKVEVLLLTPVGEDTWEVLVKPGKRALPGAVIEFPEGLTCQILDRTDFGGRIVKFEYDGVFDDIIDKIGEMPLPPYIHEKLEDPDEYQTVYAANGARRRRRRQGSISRTSCWNASRPRAWSWSSLRCTSAWGRSGP